MTSPASRPTSQRRRTRVTITIDIHDEPLVPTLIWAQRSADNLANQLWQHGTLAHVDSVTIDDTSLSR